MASLTVWTDFSKRRNSTKQPAGGAVVDVKLKENTSMENPVFIVSGLANANYCKYLDNYYFVDDIVFVTNTIVELHCSMDALATNKEAIAGYTCFVERTESLYDVMIRDEGLSQKQNGNYTFGLEYEFPDIYKTDGVYIVRIMGKNSITGYVMNDVKLRDLLNYANDFSHFPQVFQGLDDIVDGAVKGIFNPDKFIVSCKWFPLKSTNFPLSAASVISLGAWDTNVSAPSLTAQKFVMTKNNYALPATSYPNDFRKYDSNWSKIYMFLPCIGTVELDPLRFKNNIDIKYIVDLYTGALTVLLYDHGSSTPQCQYTGQIGIDVQIGKSNTNSVGYAGGLATMVAGGVAAFVNPALGVGAIAAGAGTAIKAATNPLQTMIGSVGSIATIQEQASIISCRFEYETCEISHTIGRPLMKNIQLGTVHGYIKCQNASLDSIAYGAEKDTINSYLNNGFYME